MRTLVVVALAVAWPGVVHAEPDEDPCACSPNKPGFYRKGALSGGWGGRREQLRDDGFSVLGTYAGEVFSAPNFAERPVIAGLAVLAFDADLEKLVASHLGAVHVSALGIHGRGLSEQLMDVYGVSNNVAPSDVRLFEAWFEQPLGPVSVRVGLLSADQEFVLAGHSTALINATFGIISMLSVNVLGPVYPVATPGASVHVEHGEVAVRAAIYDGEQRNEHGIPTAIGSDLFAIGEVELASTLKLGSWHHTSRGNGYYAVVDRRLDRYVGTFARMSVAPNQAVDLYIDTGIRIGPGPLRERDFASVGIAFAETERGPQTAVELTYQLQLGWLTVQPDLQLLLERERTAVIVATRFVVVL